MTLQEDSQNTLELIRHAMRCEAEAIEFALQRFGHPCVEAVELISNCTGKLIVAGVGKTGCIARKAAATFSSTGTSSVFLHAGEAAHGDLGMVSRGDVVLALSNSGRSTELLNLIPFFQRFGIPLICITGDPASELASHSQITVHIQIPKEADYNGLAPTSSSTVALALCDAIAVTIARQRGFTSEQFAMYHPGGMLGRKLLITSASIMHREDAIPLANSNMQLRNAIGVISQKGLGTLVIVEGKKVKGILTDGDIRRVLQSNDNPLGTSVGELMTADPIVLSEGTLAIEALRLMQQHNITVLPIIDKSDELVGVLHLHDLIKAGLV